MQPTYKGPMVTTTRLRHNGEDYVVATLVQHAKACPVIEVPLKDLVIEGTATDHTTPLVMKCAGKYVVLHGGTSVAASLQLLKDMPEEVREQAELRPVKVVLITKHVLKHALVVREEPATHADTSQNYSQPFYPRRGVGESSSPRREGGFGSQYEPRGNYQRHR